MSAFGLFMGFGNRPGNTQAAFLRERVQLREAADPPGIDGALRGAGGDMDGSHKGE